MILSGTASRARRWLRTGTASTWTISGSGTSARAITGACTSAGTIASTGTTPRTIASPSSGPRTITRARAAAWSIASDSAASSSTATWSITCARAITRLLASISAKFIRCAPIPIGRIPAMLRIMLPRASLLVEVCLVKVLVNVFVIVVDVLVVDVDVDVAVAPPAIPAPAPAAPGAPSGGTYRNSRAPCQSRPWDVARIGVGIIGIGRRWWSVNDRRVI